jgi:hypothetical protein
MRFPLVNALKPRRTVLVVDGRRCVTVRTPTAQFLFQGQR